MNKLEKSLEQQLEKVRLQRSNVVHRRMGISKLVGTALAKHDDFNEETQLMAQELLKPPSTWEDIESTILDSKTAKAIYQSRQFKDRSRRPSVSDVLEGKVTVELDVHQLEALMDEELFDVYSLPLLKSEFCDRVRYLVELVSKEAEKAEYAHLNLGRRPVDLDTIGLGWLNDLLLQLIIRPISRHLYRETELNGGDLDWRQGYVAGYSAQPQAVTATPRNRLVSHTDDSEVTLNLCLADRFEGGALNFRGLRGTDTAGQLHGDEAFQPIQGTALLHAGRHLHEVTQVTKGDRYAYIIWARSWARTRRDTCPCCWLNRRQGGDCVCGARWN